MPFDNLGFGNGSDGDLVISSNTTDSPVDSSCSGNINTQSLSATGAFVAGQIVLIHQTRGQTAQGTFGKAQLNQVQSYVAGTITLVNNLNATYQDSGANQAQVIVLKQYSSLTIQSGAILSAKDWDGNVGGILFYLVKGKLFVSNGSISANSKGYRGGTNTLDPATDPGEGGDADPGSATYGAGQAVAGNGAGGGGYGTAGTRGEGSGLVTPGAAYGVPELTEFNLGGAGAGANANPASRAGSAGDAGGAIFIFAQIIEVDNINGNIFSNGGNGSSGADRGGAASSGGPIFLRAVTMILGTNRVTALGGVGGVGTTGQDGGNGGDGRIRLEACTLSGTTNPSASQSVGGHNFCAVTHGIL